MANMFGHYDDPSRARSVYADYVQETHLSGEDSAAVARIVRDCKTADQLDLKLDGVFSRMRARDTPVPPAVPNRTWQTDRDADGGWSNVVKAYEDGRQ